MLFEPREPTNYLLSSGGGGMRVVGDPHMADRPVYEAGISTVNGAGRAPDADSTYRALREWSSITSMRQDSVVIRILGTVRGTDRYLKAGDSLQTTRARRISRWGALEVLNQIRGDTGDGLGGQGSRSTQEFAGDYPNAYIRVVSELAGFQFEEIETVQFF